ncbi:MAG TPA: IPT/TIG domain-containing protein, partial [Solirubrobacteraceae bacterium]
MTGHRRTGRVSRGLLGAALAAGVLLGGASTATADVVLHVVPNLPADLVVGQTGAASTITITNASDGPETWADVAVETITLVASCGTRQINGADCPGAAVDPGILKPSATATGQAGTACSGIAFTTSLIDPTEGVYAFAPAAPVVLGPGGSQTQTCVLDFTVTVPKAPVIDAAPTLAGLQTDQVAFARARAGLLVAGSADATSEVTVTPAAVSLATQVAPASITAGQAFEDTATLTAPPAGVAPTGTIGFAVYGPADPTCADQPVFTSTNQLAGSSTVSDPFTPTSPGTYRVIAGYSGDADYAAAASACGDPTEAVTVTGLPAVSGLGPAGGPESGGTQVTISGTNLSGATAVHFGGATVTPSTVSATDVSAAAP